jgi:hypothetical protein
VNPSGFCKASEAEARERITTILTEQSYRPVLIGEMSLRIGPLWSLKETEVLVETMVQEGLLRPATEEESRNYFRGGFFLV